MWLLVLAVGGCVSMEPAPPGPGPSSIEVEPIGIYFGDLPWDDPGVEQLSLNNVGDETHSVDLVTSSDALILESSGSTLGSGETATIGVGWDPGSLDALDAEIDVRMDGETTAIVPVMGGRTYPRLRMTPDRFVVGDVPVGCGEHLVGRLLNQGTGDAIVSSVELLDDSEFGVSVENGNVPMPFTLRPGDAVELGVWFMPNAEHASETTIRIASNAPLSPTLDVEVVGRGVLDEAKTVSLSWTIAPPADALTALFEINAEVAAYGDPVVDAFEAFFARLDETKIPYRVAIVEDDMPATYIDDSLATGVARDRTSAMLASLTGDQDASLEHLLDGIGWNHDWLFDDPEWSASVLHLVVMNVDMEQSGREAAYYVDQYEEFKDDPSLIRVDGIAGLPPAGCSFGVGASYASPSENLLTAVQLTGGSFRSICDDWTVNLESLAFAMQGTSFRLDGVPVESTIDVAIDGVDVTSGWSYEASTNEIVFDEATYPAVGSTVDVTYSSAPSCE
jgi:hypothetical protein